MATKLIETRVIQVSIDSVNIKAKFNVRPLPNPEDKEDKKFQELMASIKAIGCLEPPVIREIEDADGKGTGKYDLTAGFRRYVALKHLGYTLVNFSVMPPGTTELDAYYANLTENVQRADISAYELARRCADLKKEFKETGESIGKRLAKSKSHINNLLQCVENLHPKIIEAWKNADLETGFTRIGNGTSGGGFTLRDLFKIKGKGKEEQIAWFDSLVRQGGEEGSGNGGTPRDPNVQRPLTALKMMALVKALDHDTAHSEDYIKGAKEALRYAAADLRRNPFAAAVKAFEEAQAEEAEEAEAEAAEE